MFTTNWINSKHCRLCIFLLHRKLQWPSIKSRWHNKSFSLRSWQWDRKITFVCLWVKPISRKTAYKYKLAINKNCPWSFWRPLKLTSNHCAPSTLVSLLKPSNSVLSSSALRISWAQRAFFFFFWVWRTAAFSWLYYLYVWLQIIGWRAIICWVRKWWMATDICSNGICRTCLVHRTYSVHGLKPTTSR